MARLASGPGSPSNWPELTRTWSRYARRTPDRGSLGSAGTTTARTEAVALRELEVALVVRGHGHDRAGAVLHQHVIGHPDRNSLVVHRIDRERPVKMPSFSRLLALDGRAAVPAAPTRQGLGLVAVVPSSSLATSGCSGASTKNVAPKSVSGRS